MHKNPFPEALLEAVMKAKKPSGVLVAPCRCRDDAMVKYKRVDGKLEVKCLKCEISIKKQL
jgi:hypothetical protein